MKIRRISAAAAVLAAGALVLTACSNTPDGHRVSVGVGRRDYGRQLVVAETNEFFSFNSSTANGNTDINSKISLATNSNFYYIDGEPQGSARRVVRHDREDERRPADGQVHRQRGPDLVRR